MPVIGVIKRERAGKKSIARNSVRMCGMNASEHRQYDQQTPWQHRSIPLVSLSTPFDRLKKAMLKASVMHYCVALCLFGIGPEA
jgi:hypothetical protein